MSVILRGTTPGLVISVSPDDFRVGDVVKLEITVWNGRWVTQYGLEDVTVDSIANSYTISFSEADTLVMEAAKSFRWQMRCMFEDGSIVGTLMSGPVDVAPLKSKEVMSG